jgi:hypothetical protein
MRLGITLMLALALAVPAHAISLRKQCNQQCSQEIGGCVLAHGGRHLAKCKAQVRGQCRRNGIQACLPPTTTTSTTLRPTTTSSTTTSTTTTTTTPVPSSRFAPYAGRWEFNGTLASNTCANQTYGLQDAVSIHVTASGGGAATVDSIDGLTLAGSFDDANGVMLMAGTYSQSSCTVQVAFDMADPITIPEGGAAGFNINCGFTTCTAIWTGTWVRL